MEILNRREQIAAKSLPPVIGEEKAGKSKYGVVKIGDGINVSNGVISVPGSGGVSYDVLWNGDLSSTEVEITDALAKPISDYVFLTANQVSSGGENSGGLLYVPGMIEGESAQNFIGMLNPSLPVKIRLYENKVFISSTSNVTNISVIGIK